MASKIALVPSVSIVTDDTRMNIVSYSSGYELLQAHKADDGAPLLVMAPCKPPPRSWRHEEEDFLITFYIDHPELWNIRHPLYFKRDVRISLLNELAERLRATFAISALTANDVKAKFKNLRSVYFRELKKVNQARKAMSTGYEYARNYVPKWVHFQSLDFLRDYKQSDASVENLGCASAIAPETKESEHQGTPILPKCDADDSLSDWEVNNAQSDDNDAHSDSPHSSKSASTASIASCVKPEATLRPALRKPHGTKRPAYSSNGYASQDVMCKSATRCLDVTNGERLPQRDEWDSFGEALAIRLRKLPRDVKLDLRYEFESILYKTEKQVLDCLAVD